MKTGLIILWHFKNVTSLLLHLFFNFKNYFIQLLKDVYFYIWLITEEYYIVSLFFRTVIKVKIIRIYITFKEIKINIYLASDDICLVNIYVIYTWFYYFYIIFIITKICGQYRYFFNYDIKLWCRKSMKIFYKFNTKKLCLLEMQLNKCKVFYKFC